ncbi:MAG TPA: hypothetical protein VLV78_04520 [Thermoanaerobaculia bacterium]|nr:hypothetical protein [Thermoanaerobaculia bacterium]
MKRHLPLIVLFLAIAMTAAAEPVREIPGVTAKDAFPKACVDCHTGKAGMPAPLSTTIKNWSVKVDPKMVAKLQPFAPKGLTLKGKHPAVAAKDVPAMCLKCHTATSKVAPPLAPMMHGIHFTGGEANPYLTKFGGECTNCHKFNAATAQWSFPAGSE